MSLFGGRETLEERRNVDGGTTLSDEVGMGIRSSVVSSLSVGWMFGSTERGLIWSI